MDKLDSYSSDASRPGSQAAINIGCKCARIDNHHGAGRYGDGSKYGYFISGDCLVHNGAAAPLTESKA